MEYTLTRSTMKKSNISNEEQNTNNGRFSTELVREGVVIISEFVSSARVMGGSIIINPWKSDEVFFIIIFNSKLYFKYEHYY